MNSRQHAIIEKKVINLDASGDRHIICGWDDCERDGVDLHQVRINYGTARYPQIIKHVFCTNRHKMFFVTSHVHYGRLPPGYRRSFI